ncbi:hypothetical protein JOB18_044023 [Solea senegalensis]|uniref:Uncharacterized protein n=1 Tax=Solea senegalensis TaxID=28829 RepID=A0AAV6PMI2_SOLSE|nr:hypothetical protein JOB18_044023 [Solea senegalensis]
MHRGRKSELISSSHSKQQQSSRLSCSDESSQKRCVEDVESFCCPDVDGELVPPARTVNSVLSLQKRHLQDGLVFKGTR